MSVVVDTSAGRGRGRATWVLAALVGLVGCSESGPATQPTAEAEPGKTRTETRKETQSLLSNALALLNRRLESRDAFGLALNQLNQYITRTVKTQDLALDPEVEKLIPEPLRPTARRAHFGNEDAQHINHCFFFRDLANIIVRDTALDRQRVDAVFAWVMRNIELMPSVLPDGSPAPPERPFNVTLRGFGTGYDRAWVFVSLLRQLDVNAFMVCRSRKDKQDQVQLGDWLCGVLVDGEVYLYDQRIGSPIVGPDGRGVATLGQVLADPSLLEQMDVGPFHYDVGPADLQLVVAWLEAQHPFWAPRMKLLQDQLVGKDRVVVYEDLLVVRDRVAKALPAGKSQVALAPPPAGGRQAMLNVMALRALFSHLRLAAARWGHLAGRYESALALYPECRLPDKRPKQGIPPLPANASLFRRGQEDATYWLGLAKIDQGRPESALWWLKHYLKRYPKGRWAKGARWAIGELLAGQGKAKEALPYYAQASGIPSMDYGYALKARAIRRRLGLKEPAPATQAAASQGARTQPSITPR